MPHVTRSFSRRGVLAGAAALGLSAPFVGSRPGRARQDSGATLTIAMNGAPTNLDPHAAYDYRSTLPIFASYEGLIKLDGGATDKYVGVIAETWSANEDKSVWTFTIRPGVTFQNGDPCDAEAVRSSFERFLTMGLGPVNVMSRFITDPADIIAPDERTVVFDLRKPQPMFEAALSSQYGPLVLNAKIAKEHEEDGDWGNTWAQINMEGMGTGPYKLTEYEPGASAVFQQNETYWRGWEGGEFAQIVLRVVEENETRSQLIENGDADIIDTLTPEALDALASNPDLTIDRQYSTQDSYLAMSITGPLESPEARQAMCYAFPYDEVVTGVYKGYGKRARGPVAEIIHGWDAETFQYETDLEMAKELFAKAGVAEGDELTLMQESGDESLKSVTQLFQASLAQIGITLTIESVDLNSYINTVYGDAPIEEHPNVMPYGWWPDYNDAYNHLYPQLSCEAWGSKGANGGYYCNDTVEAGLLAARDAPDDATYLTAMAEVQQIAGHADPAAIYYLQPEWTTVLRKSVAGFVFNPIYIGTYDFYKLRRSS